ncbi:MAG: DMT family transporter [Chloroflexota bacterium]|nr:DMT family transporter [Chloroflexota bacterium]
MSSITSAHVKAFLAAVIWGASFVATKAALREISPVTLIFLRFGIGVVVLSFAVWRLRVLTQISRRDLLLLAILGAIGIPVHQGLQANGLLFTAATSMAWLVALTPVFTALLAWLFLSESFGAMKTLGLTVAFLGAFAVITQGTFSADSLRLPSTTGDFLALASSLNWAIFTIASKPVLKRVHPTLMMTVVMGVGWMLVLPFLVGAQGWNEINRLSFTGWSAVAFLGIFCSGIAYIFWYDALAQIDASQTAAFIYLEPFVTVAVAALVLVEAFTPITFLGGLTILLGVYWVNRSSRQRAVAVVGAGD